MHAKNFKDRTGEEFGRLTVVEYVGRTTSGNARWLCKCSCGESKVVRATHLLSGNVKSCGCLEREVNERQDLTVRLKACNRCGKNKVFPDAFVKRSGGKRRNHCIECQRKMEVASVNKKRDWYRQRAAESRKRRHRENMRKVVAYLREHPCVDCGEDDWMVLQFDHVRGEKLFMISHPLRLKWVKIQKEIQKCDVRCANCHTRKTIKECGYLEYI